MIDIFELLDMTTLERGSGNEETKIDSAAARYDNAFGLRRQPEGGIGRRQRYECGQRAPITLTWFDQNTGMPLLIRSVK